MGWRMRNDIVMLEKVKEEAQTTSGLFIPGADEKNKVGIGFVKAHGPDVEGLAVGDKVLFDPRRVYNPPAEPESIVLLQEAVLGVFE
jgi:co-chaperonin GroES (HSP10)